jgi:hypothetical protein
MVYSNTLEKIYKNRKRRNIFFLILMAIVILAVFIPVVYIIVQIVGGNTEVDIYKYIALLILLVWFCGLAAFYAWSIYFYNIKRGLTEEEWAAIHEKNENSTSDESIINIENPHKEETLGLPRGTIRGTLALTLMIGGIAMTIVSFGMDTQITEDTFFVDNLDFFKTAFLMMIAFYFGNKSLEMIGYKSKRVYGAGDSVKKVQTNKETETTPLPLSPLDSCETLKTVLSKENIAKKSEEKNDNVFVKSDFDVPGAVQ